MDRHNYLHISNAVACLITIKAFPKAHTKEWANYAH